MRLRSLVKRIAYGVRPFYRGAFRYFGQTVYFPAGSHIFERACAEGIYEQQTASLIATLVKPNTTYIDIGANIGLLSIPVLAESVGVSVVSVEASPGTFQYLQQTWAKSEHRDRWRIIETAVDNVPGKVQFWTSTPESSAFDGLRDTGRGGPKQVRTVRAQTLDEIWQDLGSPPVSLVKIDVEGGEGNVLAGGRRMIGQERPIFVIEWSRPNLAAYGVHPASLLDICRDMGYHAYAYPQLCLIDSEPLLDVAMARTETFLLVSRFSNTPDALPNSR